MSGLERVKEGRDRPEARPGRSYLHPRHGIASPLDDPFQDDYQTSRLDYIGQLLAYEKEERERRELAMFHEMDASAGRVSSPEIWHKFQKGRDQTLLMSDVIADRMQRLAHSPNGRPRTMGKGGYHDGDPQFIVGVHSHFIRQIAPYRANKMVPYIAQQKRSRQLKELEYFMLTDNAKRFEMWVVHDGPRCLAINLKARFRKQNRKCADFNKHPLPRRLGVEIVLRANEAGSPVAKTSEKIFDPKKGRKERRYILDENGNKVRKVDELGRQTWHPHTHLLVRYSRWLTKEENAELVEFATKHFETPKLIDGEIHDAREVCKYLVKIDDLQHVRDIDFMRFFKHTKGAHLIRAMGKLKVQMAKHKEQCLALRWRPAEGEDEKQMSLVPVKNWNASVISAKRHDGAKYGEAAYQLEKKKNGRNMQQAVIIARMAPIPLFTPVSEPVLLLRGNSVDIDQLLAKKMAADIALATAEHWESGNIICEALYGVDAVTAGRSPWLYKEAETAQEASASKVPAHTTTELGKTQPEDTATEEDTGFFKWGEPGPSNAREPEKAFSKQFEKQTSVQNTTGRKSRTPKRINDTLYVASVHKKDPADVSDTGFFKWGSPLNEN